MYDISSGGNQCTALTLSARTVVGAAYYAKIFVRGWLHFCTLVLAQCRSALPRVPSDLVRAECLGVCVPILQSIQVQHISYSALVAYVHLESEQLILLKDRVIRSTFFPRWLSQPRLSSKPTSLPGNLRVTVDTCAIRDTRQQLLAAIWRFRVRIIMAEPRPTTLRQR